MLQSHALPRSCQTKPFVSAEQDKADSEPIRGSEQAKASVHDLKVPSVDECLRLALLMHGQELQRLAALRTENARLKKQLASGTDLNIPEPGANRLSKSSISECSLVDGSEHEGLRLSPRQPQQTAQPQPTKAFMAEDAAALPNMVAEAVDGKAQDASVTQNEVSPVRLTHFRTSASLLSHGSTTSAVFPLMEVAFPLMEHWQTQVDPHRLERMTFGENQVAAVFRDCDNEEEVEGQLNPTAVDKFIAYPSSPGRLIWDLVGAVLILYDLFAIPLEAFSPPRSLFLIFMDWFTLVFWTANMPMALQVGYVSRGVTIMSFHKIVKNYLTTWFLVDVITVLPDWIFTLASLNNDDGERSSAGSGVKLLRTLRLIRMVRLLRLLKLRRILRSLSELIETEYTSIFANIAKMIVLMLVINHYIGCIWYFIGQSHDGDNTWVVYHRFEGATWFYQYLTAFHWAITQFTPASMHVQPQNSMERAFAILVVVFALVGFSYVVGSITGSLTQLRSMQEESYKQFWILRRYLKQNGVPLALSGRIQRYLEHAWASQRQTLNLKSSKLFSLLSEQLESELQYEISLPFLRVHKLFSELSSVSSMTMRRIAWTAMSRKLLAQGDSLFIPAETATHMYILVNGCMEYRKPTDDPNHAEGERLMVSTAEDFIAEPVLWTPTWVHLGALTAMIETEVLMLDPKRFSDIIHRSPPALSAAVIYGRKFISRLNSVEAGDLSDVFYGEQLEQHNTKWSMRFMLAETDRDGLRAKRSMAQPRKLSRLAKFVGMFVGSKPG